MCEILNVLELKKMKVNCVDNRFLVFVTIIYDKFNTYLQLLLQYFYNNIYRVSGVPKGSFSM